MEETFYRLAIKKTAFYGQIQLQNLALYHWQKLGSELHQTKCPAGCNPPTGTNRYGNRRRCMERSYIQSEDRLILYKALSRIHPNYRIVLHLIFFEDMTNTQAAKVMKKNPRQITNLVYRAKHALKSEPEKEGFHYEEL